MTKRFPLPIEEDMYTFYGLLQPRDDRGRSDILRQRNNVVVSL